MAKQVINYVCEICGRRHKERADAEKCENEHYQAKSITSCDYDTKDNKREFPISVNIKLKNNAGEEKVITYHRK